MRSPFTPRRAPLLAASLLIAAFLTQTAPAQDTLRQTLRISPITGVRRDNFRWSIAGNSQGTDPNIYSELVWTDLSGSLLGADLEWKVTRFLSFCLTASKRFITAGGVTDTDYQGDNRTERLYDGQYHSNRGNDASGTATLEYAVPINWRFTLIPCLGYTLHPATLFLLSDAAATVNTLHSTYAITRKSGVIGLRTVYTWTRHFFLEPSLLYRQLTYDGKADWNLVSTFRHPVSFEDRADGYEWETAVKARYEWRHRYSVFVVGNYFYGKTGKGTDDLYLQNGQTASTQFNGAIWKGGGIRTGVTLSL